MRNSRNLTPAGIFILLLLLVQPLKLNAQVSNIGKFIKAGIEDAETLMKAYLEPLPSGIGAGLNSGWVTDASPHQTLGFSIEVRGALAFIPNVDQTFDVSKLSLTSVRAADPSATISPTIGGNDRPGAKVVVMNDGQKVAKFNLPPGSGYHFVPTPMIQASVGLIKNTDITVRYIPEVHIADYGHVQMLGVAVHHEITQWLPGNDLIPFKVSILGGYTHLTLSSKLNIDPSSRAIPDPGYTGSYDNQKASITFDAYVAKIFIGKDLPFISVYGGVGYEFSTMTAALEGDYPIPVAGPSGTIRTKTVTDPIKFTQHGDNSYTLTAGVKFSLFFFNIYGQYTWADYPVVNAGIGFSFR